MSDHTLTACRAWTEVGYIADCACGWHSEGFGATTETEARRQHTQHAVKCKPSRWTHPPRCDCPMCEDRFDQDEKEHDR